MAEFDFLTADSQGTTVEPLEPCDFDFDRYSDYESEMLEGNRHFWHSRYGVAVHRRFRVPSVFTYDCRDMRRSLGLQLAALKASMRFKMDIPNFLEPWYGIGTAASAFGIDYEWHEGQAPAVRHTFASVDEVLRQEITPIAETDIGKRTLEMIEFFLDKTGGRMPISLTDTQSPMNIASHIIDSGSFYLTFFDNPDGLKRLLDIIAGLMVEFNRKQSELIGDRLVMPGHGFASSRAFSGLGMSDDIMIMLSPDQYRRFCYEPMIKAGEDFGGPVFHSCGNWSGKAETVRDLPGVLMVDGAFTSETDPDVNEAEKIGEIFKDTGIAVNARMVGDFETIENKLKELHKQGLKLIVVTYCKDPQEQDKCYDAVYSIYNYTASE